MNLRRVWWLVGPMLAPQPAAAHGGLLGGGGFYSGVAHPFLATEHFLILLAFGLLLGQATGPYERLPLAVLAASLVAGLSSGAAIDLASITVLGLALALGAVLAAALRPPIWAICIGAGIAGWIIGADTDVPLPVSNNPVEAYAPYVGVFIGVFLIALNAAALASVATRPAARIGVRVIGSWVAAIALMVLALRLGEAKVL